MTAAPAPVHIVGLYKCGTTWLLKALAAHPEVIAWREFDPVYAAHEPDRGLTSHPALALDYLRRTGTERWIRRREHGRWRRPDETFRRLFLGDGWIPLMGAEAQARAAGLPRDTLPVLTDQLFELADAQPRSAHATLLEPAAFKDTLGFRHHRINHLLDLMAAVRDAASSNVVPGLVYSALARETASGTTVVHKAADQLMQLSLLRDAVPNARCIAVIRDGRDAAVSAQHFETLMRRQAAPWRVAEAGVLQRILGWSVRAAKLAEHIHRGEIIAVRYEDLTSDFTTTMRALLTKLDLEASEETLTTMEATSSFATRSGGRMRGEAADDVLRKGVVGDWKTALNKSTKLWAWRLARRELEAFGYSEEGKVNDCKLTLS